MQKCIAVVMGLVAAFSCGVVARAGSLPINAGDPNGMAGYKGYLELASSDNPVTLKVNVEFCVFQPGTFDDMFTVPAGYWNANHYYYAFQVLNNLGGPFPPSWSGGYVGRFSAGLKGGEQVGNAWFVDEAGGVAPISADINPIAYGQVGWNFETGSPALGWGKVSDVLFYSSQYPPTKPWLGSVSGNAAKTVNGFPLPNPAVPEPATIGIFGIALAVCIKRKR